MRRALLPPYLALLYPVAAAGSLAALARSTALGTPRPELSPSWLALYLALALLASLYRPREGGHLGLGAAGLPLLAAGHGAVAAAAGAAVLLLAGEGIFRALARASSATPREPLGLLALLTRAGEASLATLAAGALWVRMTPAEIGGSAGRFVLQGIGTLATFLVVAAALRIALELWVEGAEATSWDRTALLTDVTGWAVGWLLARVLEGGGPGLAAGAFGAVALLATDAARYRLLHEGSLRRLEALEELRRAGQRMVARGGSFDALAERIASECSNVVPCSWLQFDLLSPEGTHGTWGAGPDGVLKEGPAQPPAYPTALPGVHRRPRWEVISRELRAAEQVVGRLCLWCDPRKLDSGDLRLLDSLLPHFAGSAQRALLDREASEDPLTGVAVRRVLDRRLQEVYRECCESGESMAVILCDLDFFKRINDTFGHGTGDRALVAVAQTLEQGRRATDLCARYGGEEFTLLLEKTDGDTALRVAERLREAVEALTLEEEGERVPLTLSAGVASFPELHVKTPSELVLLADEALYEAKRQGRNLCLLDLGRGRYRSPRGGLHEAQDLPGEPEVPRLFS